MQHRRAFSQVQRLAIHLVLTKPCTPLSTSQCRRRWRAIGIPSALSLPLSALIVGPSKTHHTAYIHTRIMNVSVMNKLQCICLPVLTISLSYNNEWPIAMVTHHYIRLTTVFGRHVRAGYCSFYRYLPSSYVCLPQRARGKPEPTRYYTPVSLLFPYVPDCRERSLALHTNTMSKGWL